jgi:alkanesulfonate monooxygenase SsuD/methylene tetrahydromethanopterin reductase-like flavin-dependent oxidoreductase (luciferase family)
MEFVANFMTCEEDPASWAALREQEGWHVLGCADHLFSATRAYPHVWVSLASMAAATSSVRLTSSFGNNLLRTPVEFAQASLQMQAVSGGRFEAGLGAGWERDEVVGAGIVYPPPGDRAGRYAEAVRIVRGLLVDRRVSFHGDYYDIEVSALGPNPAAGAPPLVASLGGPRTIREVAPLVDRVEIKPISAATRNGKLDIPALADIPKSHVEDLVARVRAANPTAPIGIFILCAVGDDERTKALSEQLRGTFMGGFFGPPGHVADSLQHLEGLGITRVQLSPFNGESFAALAPRLGLP